MGTARSVVVWVKWIRELIAEWIWNFMVKNKRTTALVKHSDPAGFAKDMDDLKSMALKLTASELDNKEIKDWCRTHRSWRQQMLAMETEQWNELATILGEVNPTPPPEVDPDEDN